MNLKLSSVLFLGLGLLTVYSQETTWDYFEDDIQEDKKEYEDTDGKMDSTLGQTVDEYGNESYVAISNVVNDAIDENKTSMENLTEAASNGTLNLKCGIDALDIMENGKKWLETMTKKLETYKSRSEERMFDTFMENLDVVASEVYSSAKNSLDLRKEIENLKSSYLNGNKEVVTLLEKFENSMLSTRKDTKNELKKIYMILEKQLQKRKYKKSVNSECQNCDCFIDDHDVFTVESFKGEGVEELSKDEMEKIPDVIQADTKMVDDGQDGVLQLWLAMIKNTFEMIEIRKYYLLAFGFGLLTGIVLAGMIFLCIKKCCRSVVIIPEIA